MKRREFIKSSSLATAGIICTTPIYSYGNTNLLSSPWKYLEYLGRGLNAIGYAMTALDIVDVFRPNTSNQIYSAIREKAEDVFDWLTGNDYEYEEQKIIAYGTNHYMVPSIKTNSVKSNQIVDSRDKILPIITPYSKSENSDFKISNMYGSEIDIIDYTIRKICNNPYSKTMTKNMVLPKFVIDRKSDETTYFNLNDNKVRLINQGDDSCFIMKELGRETIINCHK